MDQIIQDLNSNFIILSFVQKVNIQSPLFLSKKKWKKDVDHSDSFFFIIIIFVLSPPISFSHEKR